MNTACTKSATEEILNLVYASEELHEYVFQSLIGTTCHWFMSTFFKVLSRSHHRQFLFVKLIFIPLQLLSLFERCIFSWFLLYSILVLKGGFWVSFTKKIAYSDFVKRPIFCLKYTELIGIS